MGQKINKTTDVVFAQPAIQSPDSLIKPRTPSIEYNLLPPTKILEPCDCFLKEQQHEEPSIKLNLPYTPPKRDPAIDNQGIYIREAIARNDTECLHYINKEYLKQLRPELQEKVEQLMEDYKTAYGQKYKKKCKQELVIIEGFRTQDDQNELRKTRADYAAKTKSSHEYGKAVDIKIVNGSGRDYEILGACAKKLGMRWGGDFKSTPEPWHFDLGWNPYDTKESNIDYEFPLRKLDYNALCYNSSQ